MHTGKGADKAFIKETFPFINYFEEKLGKQKVDEVLFCSSNSGDMLNAVREAFKYVQIRFPNYPPNYFLVTFIPNTSILTPSDVVFRNFRAGDFCLSFFIFFLHL